MPLLDESRYSQPLQALRDRGCVASATWFVPGRVEMLGKHTDYCGGRSLTCAIDRGFAVAAAARSDATVRMTDARTGESTEFGIVDDLAPSAGHWSNYPMTVAKRLARNFPRSWRGTEIAFTSDLPPAAGLSSSSALIVATLLVLVHVNDLSNDAAFRAHLPDDLALADYAGAIENGGGCLGLAGTAGVGTFGGSEDHTAILLSRAGELGCYSYAPLRRAGTFDWPQSHAFVIGSSGLRAEKTGAAMPRYNRLASLARAIVDVGNRDSGRDDPHLAAMIASPEFRDAKLRSLLDGEQQRRLEHFQREERHIATAMAALAGGDMSRFAAIVNASHDDGAALLDNQVPETQSLAALARQNGARAASAFGAGFGGSVYAVIGREQAESFCKSWREAYLKAYPAHAERAVFFVTAPAAGARRCP